MINLIDYINEELVLENELLLEEMIVASGLNNMKFEKISYKDFTEITNDWVDKGTEKQKMYGSQKNILSDSLYSNWADYYKIVFDEKTLGLFGILNYNDHYDKIKRNDNERIVMNTRFKALIENSIAKKYKTLIFDEYDNFDGSEEDKTTIFKDKILPHIADVTIFYMNPEKDDNISTIAVIKVFYKKLIEMLKKDNIKYLSCDPKDSRLKRLYMKVGEFMEVEKDMFYDDEFFTKGDIHTTSLYATLGMKIWNMLVRKI